MAPVQLQCLVPMNFSEIDDGLTYYNARVQPWEHLKERINRAKALRDARRDAVADAPSLRAYVGEFRTDFLGRIGGLPQADGLPNVEHREEIREEHLTIQSLILETRPNVRATASLYLPAGVSKGTPAVLLLCGHSVDGRMADRYQIISRLLVSRGLIVLALDPTGQGERVNYYDRASGKLRIRAGTGDHEYCGFQCLLQGHNLSRYMLHDAIRAVDFLSAHPLVDPRRIGVTGSSGGGTQTALMMLVEPRLAAAAPATFVTSRRAIFDSGYGQDAEQIWPGFSESGYDHVDLLAAFAPKPLCILSVTYDFFPIDGTRTTLAKAKRFWEMFGCAENLRSVEDRHVHCYTDPLGRAAADFFAESFRLSPPKIDECLTPLSPEKLRATQSGQILGDFPESKTIFDENRAAFAEASPDTGKAKEFLRKAVFKDRSLVDLNLRITREFPLADIVASSGFWWSQAGILNSGILLRSAAPEAAERPVTIALWEDGTRAMVRHDSWIRQEIAGGRTVLVLNVTGMGPLEPHPFNSNPNTKAYYGTFFRIADDLVTLGDSFAAMRTHDVLRSLDALAEWDGLDGSDVRFYLHGPYGIYGALASALDERIAGARWVEPMPAYAEMLRSHHYNDRDVKSLIIPGLVRLADWPDLARCEIE